MCGPLVDTTAVEFHQEQVEGSGVVVSVQRTLSVPSHPDMARRIHLEIFGDGGQGYSWQSQSAVTSEISKKLLNRNRTPGGNSKRNATNVERVNICFLAAMVCEATDLLFVSVPALYPISWCPCTQNITLWVNESQVVDQVVGKSHTCG